MKKFEVYKNIRKRAIIFGLPLLFFAVQMIAIISSLMVIIFSFSLGVILGLFIFNALLFVALVQAANNPRLFHWTNVFPQIISNKRNSGLNYEQD